MLLMNHCIGTCAYLGGIFALLAVLGSTWWMPDFHVALLAGPPWLVFLTVCYFIWRKFGSPKFTSGAETHDHG